jgi:hypothetical protein
MNGSPQSPYPQGVDSVNNTIPETIFLFEIHQAQSLSIGKKLLSSLYSLNMSMAFHGGIDSNLVLKFFS